MKFDIRSLVLAALLPLLLLLSGCWDSGSAQYTGIVTKTARVGVLFSTCEAEIHLVDGKGIMIADSIELSIDESHHHGEDVMALFAQLQQAQTLGTRVRISVVREAFVIDWRAHTSRLVVKVEALP